jgi:Rps23 Pro-64 3,4-dihydroxylase Tpa1-like proline 4-hydroxylase
MRLLYLLCITVCQAAYWEKNKKDIAEGLWNGDIITIENAFGAPERFDVHEEVDWVLETGKANTAEYKRYVHTGDLLRDFQNELDKYTDFFNDILLTNTSNDMIRLTKYSDEHYLELHTDHKEGRLLSVIYYNTKDWDASKCGGELLWHGGKFKMIAPKYNTLVLFIPRQQSYHRIKDLNCNNRYAYAGWLTADKRSKATELLYQVLLNRENSNVMGRQIRLFNRLV